MSKYKEYKVLSLPKIHKDVLKEWNAKDIFQECIAVGKGKPNFMGFNSGMIKKHETKNTQHVLNTILILL